ncbi:MAG TPA: hypothetical protein VK689_04050, partial [Armatimonadota bacterium]|nr:hypothetical protein [Armatimonadota bacterium]
AEAILVTLQKSGLTHARRDHPVAYLANNVEVWHGFDSFARLAERLRKRDEGREYRAQADALLPAIDRWFWDQAEGYYAAAVHAGGKRESGLGRWDPHWKANLRAIALLPGDERRHDLFARLARRAEPLPEKIETADDLEKLVGWGMAVLARHNRAALEQYQLRLSRVAWDRLKDLDPALLGQALHVGGGTVSPAPEPEE